jgi:hypothetical protein
MASPKTRRHLGMQATSNLFDMAINYNMVSCQSFTQLETLELIQMPVITRSSAALQPSTKRAVADDLLEWQGESQHEASVNEVLHQRKKPRT